MFKSIPIWISLPLRYALGALIIFWLLQNETLDWSNLFTLSSSFIFCGIFLVIIQLFLSALRVKIFLKDRGVNVSLSHCIQFNSVGIFYSTFLPGGISGDIARAYFFWKKYPEASKSSLAGALFLDRFFGLIIMISIGLLAATIMLSSNLIFKNYIILGWVFLIGGLFLFIIFCNRINFDENKISDTPWQRLKFNFYKFISKINLENFNKLTILRYCISFAFILQLYL